MRSSTSEDRPPQRHSFWVWNIGRVAGIDIRVHLTLLLLLAWIVGTYVLAGAGLRGTIFGVLLMIAVFATIVVHELGHALVARHYGYRTRDIMLLPIGGLASLEHMPERPSQELAVALVGPAINLAIAVLLWIGIAAAHGPTRLHEVTTVGGAFVAQLLWINVLLAGFNLIPAFPMDGGRALRALLAMRYDRDHATRVAANVGKAFAVVIGLVGAFYNPFLVLIAVFVWLGASQEAQLVHLHAALAGVPVSVAMLTRVEVVAPEQPLEDAAALLLSRGRDLVPVVDHGRPVGVLTRDDVAAGLAHGGARAPVGSAPRHEVVTVAPSEPLEHVLDRLRESPDAVAVVVDHGAPVGLVTAENLARYVALHARPPV